MEKTYLLNKTGVPYSADKWTFRYIGLAHHIAKWTSCLSRGVGAIITVGRRVVATGYNGAPAGLQSCRELGKCARAEVKSGEKLETCRATHAEQNALTQAAKFGISVNGGEMYVTTFPCATCMKLIISSGIKRVYYTQDYNSPLTLELAKEAGIDLIQVPFDENKNF